MGYCEKNKKIEFKHSIICNYLINLKISFLKMLYKYYKYYKMLYKYFKYMQIN